MRTPVDGGIGACQQNGVRGFPHRDEAADLIRGGHRKKRRDALRKILFLLPSTAIADTAMI